MPKVILEPDGEVIKVSPGETLMEAMINAGKAVEAPCGGLGTCGKCKVRVIHGEAVPDEVELRLLSSDDLSAGMRLACRLRPKQNMSVHYEDTLSLATHKLFAGDSRIDLAFRPSVSKVAVVIGPPSLEKQWSATERLRYALAGHAEVKPLRIDVLRCLNGLLDQRSPQEITVVLRGDSVITVERGNSVDANYAVAVDIGTTTIASYLLDVYRQRLIDTASSSNPQATYGADLISRIEYASDDLKLQALKDMLLNTVNGLISELARRHNIETTNIYEVALVGNTCMSHIFWGLDVRALATAPYTAVTSDEVCADAVSAGIGSINPAADVFTLPNVAGFVGADTVGAILATGIEEADELKLIVDIGTNGEMVLGNRERMIACSAAAGPAFEGAHISRGMRAVPGAIDGVRIENERVVCSVIGETEAVGFCGSGLIDAVALFRRCGLIDESGYIISGEEALERSRAVKGIRLAEEDGASSILFGDSADGRVKITQRDIREVQLAKAAIRAGAILLLKYFGCEEKDISLLLLAGAFGNYINKSSALEIGLLPAIDAKRIISAGNAAGVGAVKALASLDDRYRARRLAQKVEYIELSLNADFQREFVASMLF
ncbi:MAG: ASKHA domain-containing protein [bacterium]|jgi:uncharacterized 2Fe-2S/4Fe-4S cluster protein (DUF4445 family)